jgi:glycosyltransferase involved in cell wall biosynthesis
VIRQFACGSKVCTQGCSFSLALWAKEKEQPKIDKVPLWLGAQMTYTNNEPTALLLARALHAPWNEGTRVIGRDLARVAGSLRPLRTLSLTHDQYIGQPNASLAIEHIATRHPYGARSDYAALSPITRAVETILAGETVGVAHLVGLPLALAPWLRRRGIPVVSHVTLAQQSYRGPVERLRAAVGWRCFDRWVDAYACTSQAVSDALAAQGYPATKLRVVPPPIDVGRFHRVDRAVARRALGLPEEAFLVVYIGTISPLRFPAEQVLRALSLAAVHIPNLSLAVFAPIGTHPYNLAWAAGHVRRAVLGSALPVSVEPRDLSEEQKIALYGAADVVLLPFSAPVAVEPPLTLLEAMACQATVAVTPAANRSQIIANRWNGIAYSAPEDLSQRLVQLHALGAPVQRALGTAARASVVERYSFAAVAQVLAGLWQDLGEARASRVAAAFGNTVEKRVGASFEFDG